MRGQLRLQTRVEEKSQHSQSKQSIPCKYQITNTVISMGNKKRTKMLKKEAEKFLSW